jgi:hypothetical protein
MQANHYMVIVGCGRLESRLANKTITKWGLDSTYLGFAISQRLQAGGPVRCLAAPAYLVALYVMLCWTVSCRDASTS